MPGKAAPGMASVPTLRPSSGALNDGSEGSEMPALLAAAFAAGTTLAAAVASFWKTYAEALGSSTTSLS